MQVNSLAPVAVDSTGETILAFAIPEGTIRSGILDVTIQNTGTDPLNQFYVQTAPNSNAPLQSYFGNADFTDQTNPNLIFCTTIPPESVAPGQISSFKIRIGASTQVAFVAYSAGHALIQVWCEIL